MMLFGPVVLRSPLMRGVVEDEVRPRLLSAAGEVEQYFDYHGENGVTCSAASPTRSRKI